ncbi:DUF6931 family protein [Marinibacterium sp. SX1]|uniref:DUF6931 family protein n=1 Tax=Marinibacterium sp. SX1 TaxID=3388424 RepID=UPI003D17E63F
MSDRFSGMIKVPQEPAAKLLARAGARLTVAIEAPASAGVDAVLAELEARGELFDMLHLLAVALPPRERVWWACLAARDYVGPASERDPRPLSAAEAWVFDPSDDNRTAASDAIDAAYVDDNTVHCAMAALYFDGTLGPGDLARFPAPAGAAEAAAFGMNMVALGEMSDRFEEHGLLLVDRAVDIARGGNGRLEETGSA